MMMLMTMISVRSLTSSSSSLLCHSDSSQHSAGHAVVRTQATGHVQEDGATRRTPGRPRLGANDGWPATADSAAGWSPPTLDQDPFSPPVVSTPFPFPLSLTLSPHLFPHFLTRSPLLGSLDSTVSVRIRASAAGEVLECILGWEILAGDDFYSVTDFSPWRLGRMHQWVGPNRPQNWSVPDPRYGWKSTPLL